MLLKEICEGFAAINSDPKFIRTLNAEATVTPQAPKPSL